MIAAPIPENDSIRLDALFDLNLLDTEAEERFDRITRLAQMILNVPIVLISLIDKNRQWFKSKCGLDVDETGRDISFCGHAIMEDELFYIPNALEDKRFFDNPLVTGKPNVIFYAGQPLKEKISGLNVGTLCFIDNKPRNLAEEEKTKIFDLAKITENEINILTLTRAMIIQKESEERVKEVMDSVGEGIILIKPTFLIGSKYSKWTEEIFQTQNIANKKFLDLISEYKTEDKYQDISNFLQLMFKNTIDEATLIQLNPMKELKCIVGNKIKYLNIKVSRVYEDKKIKHLVCTITDITKEKLLSLELEERDRKTQSLMEKMFDVLHVEPSVLIDFISSTEIEISSVEEYLNLKTASPEVILEEAFRAIHTIKGDASLLGLNMMVEKAHQLESKISDLIVNKELTIDDKVYLKNEIKNIEIILEEIKKIVKKFEDFQSGLKLNSDSEILLSVIEKQIVKLTNSGEKKIQLEYKKFNSNLVPVKYRKIVKDIIIQLVKNSVDHGIESAKEREGKGKNIKGTISIETEARDNKLIIVYQDDGLGLDIEKIKKIAINKKLISEKELNQKEQIDISELIYLSGLSTSDKVTITSGRGVGMDIVKKRIDYISGTVSVEFEKDKYCRFILSLPLN